MTGRSRRSTASTSRPDATFRFVNIARWESLERFQAAHDGDEFRRVVSMAGWSEFPSSPALYEVVVEHDAQASGPGEVI